MNNTNELRRAHDRMSDRLDEIRRLFDAPVQYSSRLALLDRVKELVSADDLPETEQDRLVAALRAENAKLTAAHQALEARISAQRRELTRLRQQLAEQVRTWREEAERHGSKRENFMSGFAKGKGQAAAELEALAGGSDHDT